VSLFTSNSRRFLIVFFLIVGLVPIPFLAASEWMLRTFVLPYDSFEYIAKRLRETTNPDAAFGDSHVAAVSTYDRDGIANLGIGATTIRRIASRVEYYYTKIKPGKVIIQADPHLFAEYRLEAQGAYIPESYAQGRLRVFDERHRRFMFEYWKKFIKQGGLHVREEAGRPDQLWRTMAAKEATKEKEAVKSGSSQKDGETLKPGPLNANDPKIVAEFEAFMDWEVGVHTPVIDFRRRDEARIYAQMLDFLIARGATACLVNYPVDLNYRKRADKIPLFAEVRDFYKELAAQRHIRYVSFWSRFDDPSMYQNTDHVNRKGSSILSREARDACFGKG
jgi:hypothetical protein